MISWKHSFNRLNEENEIAKKKQQALDSLYEKGRISQSTHDSFNTEIAAAIAEIEKQQKDLIQKMTAKTAELQGQIKTLEILLANYEIQHVAGEIDETTYTLEINLLSNGLETAKRELETIQTAITQLCAPIIQEPTAAPAAIPTVEVAPMQLQEVIEVAVAAAPVEICPAEVIAAPEPIIQEPIAAPIVEAPAPIEQPAAVAQAEIIQTPPEPVVAEAAPVIEQPVIVEEPVAVVEAPVAEPAPILEAPAVVVEQPLAEASTVEVPVEQPAVAEAAVVEQPAAETVEVAEAQETVAPEPAAVVEEAKVEKPALDEFEVAEPDVVQKELLQAVEEIAENPFPAPQEAHVEEIAEAPAETSAEMQPVPIHTAKESLPEVSSSDSEHKE